MSAAVAVIVGYIIGGIPTGIILSRLIKGVDPRATGSGSSGATNVSRVLGKSWGIIVLIIDALKGFLPAAFLAPVIMQNNVLLGSLLLGLGAVIGHIWTPYAGFRGGKGVATAAGAMAAISFTSLGSALVVFIIVVLATRMVSVSSLSAAVSFPVACAILRQPAPVIVTGVLLAGLLAYTHRENIKRVAAGTERKLF
jgi:glycerol-3-phosphate acyltransferase PlsY